MNLGVIFDSDGVVVDSEHQSLASFKDAIAEQGINLSDEDLWQCCGLTDEAIIQQLQKKYTVTIDLQRFKKRKFELYFRYVDEQGLRIFPGVFELLDSLERENIPYALASSGPQKKIEFNLTKVRLLDRFITIISGEDVVESKPAPFIFLKAAEKIGRNPADCVVIEDSPNGLLGAKRAGMKSIALRTTFTDDALLAEATHIVDSLQDISVPLLKSLIQSK